jgi:hypothetical protein
MLGAGNSRMCVANPSCAANAVPKAKRNSRKARILCSAEAARLGLISRFIIVHGKMPSIFKLPLIEHRDCQKAD